MCSMLYITHWMLTVLFTIVLLQTAKSKRDVQYEVRHNYCSFFNNRAPTAQPGLRNCTWFKENSCCLQQEIEATFGRVKPLKGAMLSCQKYLNYLMCYICSPNQHIFYQNERLTVCEDFCDKFYEACDTAILKGSPIKDLYSSGKEFCLSRRFLVSDNSCFNFDQTLDRSRASKICSNFFMFVLMMTTICFMNDDFLYGSESSLYQRRKSRVRLNKIVCVVCQNHRKGNKRNIGRSFITMDIVMCIFVLLLVIPVHVVDSQNTYSKLTEDNVKNWAHSLEQVLSKLVKQGLQYENLEEIFSHVQYENVEMDGKVEIMKIRNELVDFFGEKQLLATQLAEKVLELFDGWKHEYSATNISHLSQLPLVVYKDADLISHLPLDQHSYNRKFNADILLDSSVVKVADDASRSNKDVIDVVQLTASLDEIFIANLQQHPDIRWQYFGSTLGMQRSYPGKEWSRNFVGFTEDFDPRARPWYLSATSGTKDVVIVLDISSSMAQNLRLERGKEVIQWILNTMTKHDRVNIVLSRSSHWDNKGVKSEYSAEVVGCVNSALLQATSNTVKELLASVNAVTAAGASDHREAFHLAFDLLGSGSTQRQEVCNPLVLFITDADVRDGRNRCSRGYHKHYHDGTKEFVSGKLCEYNLEDLQSTMDELQNNSTLKAQVLTFVVEDEADMQSSVYSPLGEMTCDHGGVIVTVSRHTDTYQSMLPYFTFLKQTTGSPQAIWTSPYVDKSGLGLMMTVSVPVLRKVDNSLLGVVGVDVPLDKIESLLKQRVWGDVYAFLVDRTDLAAIVHPYAKPTAQLLDEPVFSPVRELETHNGEPAAFEQVIAGILGADTGEVLITENAVRPVSDQLLLWHPVHYTRYLYTDIPDSDFSIVLNVGMTGESFPYKRDVLLSDGKHYLSDMDKYAEYTTNIPGAYLELNTTNTANKYQGVEVSLAHSTVYLTPQAFCQPYSYKVGTPNFTQVHSYINSEEGEQQQQCDQGTYRRDVWSDVQLTAQIEQTWRHREEEVKESVLWTYVATDSGVMRIYPGVRVHKTYDPTVRAWYRRSREGSSVHTSHVYFNALPHTTKVVTFSKSLKRHVHSKCTSEAGCRNDSVQAVVAMDVSYQHLEQLLLQLKQQFHHKYCGMFYECPEGTHTCQTKCYLVTKGSYLAYADDISGLTDWPKEEYEAVSLASRHGYIFNLLIKAGVFIRHHRLNYQGICKRSSDIHDEVGGPSFQEDVLRRRGPIPRFENEYSCIQESVVYQASEEVLHNTSYVLAGELSADPCGEGRFHLLTLPQLDLFLLVLEDYRAAETRSINCRIANSVVSPGSFKLAREVCPSSQAHQPYLPGSRSCQHRPEEGASCGWSGATSHTRAGCATFTLLLLLLAATSL